MDRRARVVAPVGAADRRHLVVDPGVGRRAPEVVRRVVVVVPTVGRRRLVGLVVVRRVVGVVRMVVRRVVVALRRLVAQVVVRPGPVVALPVVVVRRLLVALPGHRLREALRDLRAWCFRPAWPRRHRRRSPC